MYVFAVHISTQTTYVQSPLRVLVVGRDSHHRQVCQVPRQQKKATGAKPLFNPICFLCFHHFSSNLPHCPPPKRNKLSSSDEESSFRVFNRSMRRPTSSYFGSLPARMSVVHKLRPWYISGLCTCGIWDIHGWYTNILLKFLLLLLSTTTTSSYYMLLLLLQSHCCYYLTGMYRS